MFYAPLHGFEVAVRSVDTPRLSRRTFLKWAWTWGQIKWMIVRFGVRCEINEIVGTYAETV
jgi:hypothetical protein